MIGGEKTRASEKPWFGRERQREILRVCDSLTLYLLTGYDLLCPNGNISSRGIMSGIELKRCRLLFKSI